MNTDIKIIKRDGRSEIFDPDKIIKVVTASGLRPVDAEELAKKISEWVRGLNRVSITSIEIRDQVFKELAKMDQYASGLYAWYQNLKDKKYSNVPKQ